MTPLQPLAFPLLDFKLAETSHPECFLVYLPVDRPVSLCLFTLVSQAHGGEGIAQGGPSLDLTTPGQCESEDRAGMLSRWDLDVILELLLESLETRGDVRWSGWVWVWGGQSSVR